MGEVEQIIGQIRNLCPRDLAELRAWFADFDSRIWDRQIEADSKSGKLERLVEESRCEPQMRKSRAV